MQRSTQKAHQGLTLTYPRRYSRKSSAHKSKGGSPSNSRTSVSQKVVGFAVTNTGKFGIGCGKKWKKGRNSKQDQSMGRDDESISRLACFVKRLGGFLQTFNTNPEWPHDGEFDERVDNINLSVIGLHDWDDNLFFRDLMGLRRIWTDTQLVAFVSSDITSIPNERICALIGYAAAHNQEPHAYLLYRDGKDSPLYLYNGRGNKAHPTVLSMIQESPINDTFNIQDIQETFKSTQPIPLKLESSTLSGLCLPAMIFCAMCHNQTDLDMHNIIKWLCTEQKKNLDKWFNQLSDFLNKSSIVTYSSGATMLADTPNSEFVELFNGS